MVQVIGFDCDDTLWESEDGFRSNELPTLIHERHGAAGGAAVTSNAEKARAQYTALSAVLREQ